MSLINETGFGRIRLPLHVFHRSLENELETGRDRSTEGCLRLMYAYIHRQTCGNPLRRSQVSLTRL